MIKTPFEAGQKSKQDEPPIQGISWNSETSRKFPGSLAYRYDGYQTQVEKGEEARISRPSGDVWYGNSWHDFGDSDATTTRPAPGARTKKRARSAVQGDGAPQEWEAGSRRCRAGVGDLEVAGGEGELQAVAQIPARYASANKTSVTCRYQPMKLRTS